MASAGLPIMGRRSCSSSLVTITSARGAARTATILHKLVQQGLHRPPPQPPGPLDLTLPVDLLAMRNSTAAPHSAGIWATQLSAG